MKGFVDLSEHCPKYEAYIKELHNSVVHDARVGKKWWRDLPGFSSQSFPDVVHTLCNQVLDHQQAREKNEQARIRCAAIQQQKNRELVQQRVQSHAEYFQEYSQEYLEITEETDDALILERLHARAQAIAQSHEHHYQLTMASYELSYRAHQLLQECSVESRSFAHCDGSEIQHQIHSEMIILLDQTAAIRYAHAHNQSMQLLTNTIGRMADVTISYNAAGHVRHALTLADCGHAFLECLKGIAEGVGDGFYNTACALTDPVKTVVGMARGVETASWCVANVLYEICELRVGYMISPHVTELQLDLVLTNIDAVTTALAQKIAETPSRQITRAVTANVVETALTGKCLQCMYGLYQRAHQQVINMINFIEQSIHPPPMLAGYPGIVIGSNAAELVSSVVRTGNTANFFCFSAIGQFAKGIAKLKPLGRGSTGRTEPANLTEKLVMEEVMANPNIGRPIDIGKGMTDKRWPQEDGWKKMTWYKEEVEIHYVAQYENGIIIAIDDFKFKNQALLGCI